MTLKQWSSALTAISLGSFIATHLLAWEARGATQLGPPWIWYGQIPLYAPYAGWVWAWQFRLTPLTPFLHAAVVFVGVAGLASRPCWIKRQRQAPESRWSTRRDL